MHLLHFQFQIQFKLEERKNEKKSQAQKEWKATHQQQKRQPKHVKRKPSEKMRLLTHCTLHQIAAVLQHQHESSQKGTQTEQKYEHTYTTKWKREEKNAQPKKGATNII